MVAEEDGETLDEMSEETEGRNGGEAKIYMRKGFQGWGSVVCVIWCGKVQSGLD